MSDGHTDSFVEDAPAKDSFVEDTIPQKKSGGNTVSSGSQAGASQSSSTENRFPPIGKISAQNTAEQSSTAVSHPAMQDVVTPNPVKEEHTQKQLEILKPKIAEIFDKGVMGNPDYFKEPVNRERFFDNLSSRYSPNEISKLKGEKEVPGLADAWNKSTAIPADAPMHNPPASEPGTAPDEGIQRILNSPVAAIQQGVLGGWNQLKNTGNVYEKEGEISATGNAAEAVSKMVFGALNVLPAMSAFTMATQTASEVNQKATQAVTAGVSSILNPKTEGGKAWAGIGDFLLFAGVLGGFHEGKATISDVGKIGAEGIADGLKKFGELPLEEQHLKINDYARGVVRDNKFVPVGTPPEHQQQQFSQQAQDLMKELDNAPDALKPLYADKLKQADDNHTAATNAATTQHVADAANKTVADDLQQKKEILLAHEPETETGKQVKQQSLSDIDNKLADIHSVLAQGGIEEPIVKKAEPAPAPEQPIPNQNEQDQKANEAGQAKVLTDEVPEPQGTGGATAEPAPLTEQNSNNINQQDNAIPIGTPEEVPVGEPSGNSQEVGSGVPQSEEPARIQEQKGQSRSESSTEPPHEEVKPDAFEKKVNDIADKLIEKIKSKGLPEDAKRMGGGITDEDLIRFLAKAIIEARKAGINALKYIRNTDLYKSLSDHDQANAERTLVEQFGKDSGLHGMTKAIMSPERIEKGLSENDKVFIKSSAPKAWEAVKKKIEKNPDLPKQRQADVITSALMGEKPLVSDEDALIGLHEKVRLQLEQDDINDNLQKAQQSGDKLTEADLQLKKEANENEQADNYQFIRDVASTYGKGLSSLQTLADTDLNYAHLKNDITSEQGKPLTPEQETFFRDISNKYNALKKQLRDNETNRKAAEEIKQRADEEARKKFEADTYEKIRSEIKAEQEKNKKSPPKTVRQTTKQWADKVRTLKTKPFQFTDENGVTHDVSTMGSTWNDIVENTAKAIEGIGEVADKAVQLSKKMAEILKGNKFYDSLSDSDKSKFEKQLTDEANKLNESKKKLSFNDLAAKAVEDSGGEFHDGLKPTVDKMLKAVVEENPDLKENPEKNYQDAVDKIYDALKDGIPDLERQDVADMISGYGKFKKLSTDQTNVAMREIKAQEQADAKLKAVENNQLPLHSGSERHEQTLTIREKNQKIYQGIKEKGLMPAPSEEETNRQFKSAEQKYQRTLEHSNQALEKEIETGIKRDKSESKGKPEYTSDKTKELQRRNKQLKEIRDAKFKEPGKTDLQKLVDKAKKITDDINKAKEKGDTKTADQLAKEKELTQGQISNLVKNIQDNRTEGEKKIDSLRKQIDDTLQGKTNDKGIKEPLSEADKATIKDLQDQLANEKAKKGLTPSKDLPEVPKTEEQKKLENLQNKWDDLRQKNIEAGNYDFKDSPEAKKLKDAIFEQEVNRGLHEAKATPEDTKVEATKKAIKDNEKIIQNLKEGKNPDGTPVAQTKDGKQIVSFKKDKNGEITSPEIKSLQDFNQNLKDEIQNLLPEEIKKQALINKERLSRERRKTFLENQIENKSYAPKPKPEVKPFDAKTAEINKQIKALEFKVAEEKNKIKLANMGNFEKVIHGAALLLRADIFFDYLGIARLSLAPVFRFAEKPIVETGKYLLSNTPGLKQIFEKSISNYTPNLVKGNNSLVGSLKNYYSGVVAKETFKTAISEYAKHSLWEQIHSDKPHIDTVQPTSKIGKVIKSIIEKPQQTHGFIKTFPKMAELKSAYLKSMDNLANTINPNTGDFYDITDPNVQQSAMKIAEVNALTDIYMNDHEVSKQIKNFINTVSQSEDASVQTLALFMSQNMPIVKVPLNFWAEVIQRTPGLGTAQAISIVRRAGERGTENFRGTKNLTQEQAARASKILTHQFVGALYTTAGIYLYQKYGDKVLDDIKKAKYWLHNTGTRLLVSGIEMAKAHKEKASIPMSVVAGTGHGVKEGIKETPPGRLFTDYSNAIQNKGGLSKKTESMLISLSTSQGLANLAKEVKLEEEQDPKTFKELVAARIPWLDRIIHIPTKTDRVMQKREDSITNPDPNALQKSQDKEQKKLDKEYKMQQEMQKKGKQYIPTKQMVE
jgi:hypothetical protein